VAAAHGGIHRGRADRGSKKNGAERRKRIIEEWAFTIIELGARCPDYFDLTPAESEALGDAWSKKETRTARRSSAIAVTVANVGAVVAASWGSKISPGVLLAKFTDDEETDPEVLKREAELQEKLQAADQRALLAALKAASTK
jgi:hypothetical protein